MPRDWWWGVLGNAAGTVIGAIALGVLVEFAFTCAPLVRRIARAPHLVKALAGLSLAEVSAGLLVLAAKLESRGLVTVAIGVLFVGVLLGYIELVDRLLRRFHQ